jgi:hypothetical protein
MITKSLLGNIIKVGNLTWISSNGELNTYGDGSGEPVRIRTTNSFSELKLLINPSVHFGESYAKIEAVNVGGQRIMKLSLEPGWKWSNDIKPTVGTDSCQATHLGVIVSGTVAVKHNDGTEMSYSAGDAYSIAPGHDGWVVGNDPAVVYEFAGKWGE